MRFFYFLASLCLALGLALPLHAETPSQVPNPLKANRSWVADSAQVLSDEDERRINGILSPLERRNGAEVAVVTVRNLGGQSVEEFTQELFQLWKPGKAGRDNGAIILVAVDDRKSRIQVGYGLEDVITDGQAGEISRTRMTPAFKRGAYGEGLYAGTLAVAQKIDPATVAPPATAPNAAPPAGRTETLPPEVVNSPRQPNPAIPPPSQPSASPFDPQPPAPDGSDVGGIIGTLLVLFGLLIFFSPFLLIGGIIWFVIARKRRPPTCPRCRTPMRLLPESMEDASLTEVQQFEEKIGSRDYRVWQCPQCQTESISAHDVAWSGYTSCPKCRHQTAHTTRRTVWWATESQQGLEETTIRCEWRRCGYTNRYKRHTPRLTPRRGDIDFTTGAVIGTILGGSGSHGSWGGSSNDSSSSSGPSFDSGPSDFGGGDSGGGGASDSW